MLFNWLELCHTKKVVMAFYQTLTRKFSCKHMPIFVPCLLRKWGTLKLIHLSLCLSICPSLSHKNFNLPHIFWSINYRALIFGMHDSCDKPFLLVPWPWPLTFLKVKFVAGQGTTILRILLLKYDVILQLHCSYAKGPLSMTRLIYYLIYTYRQKQVVMEQRKEMAKEALELERRLKLNRQKIMREFKEKQLHTIEILPAG